jgi:hypothetical protein
LLDNRFVADAYNVRRIVATGRKSGPLIVPPAQGDWAGISYPSVVRDDETGRFHLWYTVSNPDAVRRDSEARGAGKLAEFIEAKPTGVNSHCGIAYACSDDGVNWDLPKVGEGILSGTNVVHVGTKGVHAGCVMQRLFPDDPSRKFTAYYTDWLKYGHGGHCYAHSPDGIHWTPDPRNPFVFGESDSNNNIVRNPFGPGYFLYERPWDCAAWGWLKGNYRRRLAVAWSEDLYNWCEPRNLLYPDERDRYLYYGMSVFHRDGILFGLLSEYNDVRETMDLQLLFSRDGANWNRHPERMRLFERGVEGEFDAGMILPAYQPLEVDGELRIYYVGTRRLHNDSTEPLRNQSGIGYVAFPKARLIGRRGDRDLGILLTHPFKIDADHLFLDAQTTPVGSLVAELVEPDPKEPGGKPIPGFTRADCDAFTGDSIRHSMTWQGKNLAALKGKRVRLRVGLNYATLWSYELA